MRAGLVVALVVGSQRTFLRDFEDPTEGGTFLPSDDGQYTSFYPHMDSWGVLSSAGVDGELIFNFWTSIFFHAWALSVAVGLFF